MITDTEIKINGFRALTKSLGSVTAERFIALIQREPFDYTKWQRTLWEDQSIEEISRTAMKFTKILPNNRLNLGASSAAAPRGKVIGAQG